MKLFYIVQSNNFTDTAGNYAQLKHPKANPLISQSLAKISRRLKKRKGI